jgi:cytochrome c oxidase accessory protein FixG
LNPDSIMPDAHQNDPAIAQSPGVLVSNAPGAGSGGGSEQHGVGSLPPAPEGRVLSTLMEDGSRRWLYPRPAEGSFLRPRRILAWVLVAIFTILPYLKIAGKPAILLDLPNREFTVFGFTFLSTDTLLLALAIITLVLSICLITALAGRVWCGWMCPQTVYMEFVFRPLERLFDGPPGARHRPGKKRSTSRMLAKYAVYLVISAYLAHTFLAYFVGVEALAQWVRRSPIEHPMSFLVMLAVTGLMMFDFAYFREQTCIVACPYGRFQSVMLDRDSLIVSYDPRRGEPRGKLVDRKSGPPLGDCIDCGLCTDTCPTGIDIRDGLQLECIACTQCIDACNGVMQKTGKPQGLIRLSSQAAIEGHPGRWLRPRVIIYPALILVLVAGFLAVLFSKKSADVTILQGVGLPYSEMAPGAITNQVRVVIENRSGRAAVFSIEIAGNVAAQFARQPEKVELKAGETKKIPVAIVTGVDAFNRGICDIRLCVSDNHDFKQEVACRLLGPVRRAADATPGVSK